MFFICGCARTVTDKDALLQMDIEVALTHPLAEGEYVVVAFNQSTPPLAPSGSGSFYFPLPGQTFNPALFIAPLTLTDLYASYFSTWSDYLLCQVGGPTFYASGGSGFAANTTDNTGISPVTGFNVVHNFASATSTLKLRFFIGNIRGAVPGGTVFVTILTTKRLGNDPQNGQAGYFQDVLLVPIQVPLRVGQDIQNTIASPIDIQAWRISVF